ncbi:hypothetical protein HMPREF1326_00182 [Akkermansia sp. KLE1605]|nr:hypothetical protein HMPREF1326_00182 [Akkermansia sp. KLE1605]
MRLAVQNRSSSYVPILIATADSILCKKNRFLSFFQVSIYHLLY